MFMSGFMGLFLQLLNDSKGKCGSSGERQKKKNSICLALCSAATAGCVQASRCF